MEQISCLSNCRIQQIEVGFDKMEQFGLVKTEDPSRWIRQDGPIVNPIVNAL